MGRLKLTSNAPSCARSITRTALVVRRRCRLQFGTGKTGLEEAGSEALRAINIYEQLGAVKDLEICGEIFWVIRGELNAPSV